VNGGLPGARSRKFLDRVDGTREMLPSKCDRIKVKDGDALHYITWGGGGWGDPFERDPQLVALEVDRGLVSRDGAERYGVVLNDDLTVNESATEALRAELVATRGDVSVFDFGPSIDELRETCEAETGLPAPRSPSLEST